MMRSRLLVLTCVVALVATSGCMDWYSSFQNKRTGPGDLAGDYVKSTYSKILLELDIIGEATPHPQALSEFKTVLEQALGKTITIRQEKAATGKGGSNPAYSFAEIRDLESKHRSSYTGDDTAVLYMLYVDGTNVENADTLGAAYQGSSTVMFKGKLTASSRGPNDLPVSTKPDIRYVERAVLVHEFGHILGLVNTGTPMTTPHEDPGHPGHSNNQRSVMYWAVETSQISTVFTRGTDIPYQFDSNDLADLRALKGS